MKNFIFLCLFFSGSFSAAELLGSVENDRWTLAPQAQLKEQKKGGFTLQNSSFGLKWIKDEFLSANLRFGTSDLLSPLFVFSVSSSSWVGLVEGDLVAQSEIGDVKMGLIPLHLGYENDRGEEALIFPPSRLWQMGLLPKRDMGVSYHSKTESFETELAIHNGEAGVNADEELWYSAYWRIENTRGLGIMLSGTTGRTGVASTFAAQIPQGVPFDPLEGSRFRAGVSSLFFQDRVWFALIELYKAEFFQSQRKESLTYWHTDFSARLLPGLRLLLRYEDWHPDVNQPENLQDYSIGMRIESTDQLTSWTVLATQREEKVQRVNNNELLMIWKINSEVF